MIKASSPIERDIDRLSDEISNLEDRLAQLLNHLQEGKEDRNVADRFTYAEDWRKVQETQIASYKDRIREFEKKRKSLRVNCRGFKRKEAI